MKKSYYRYFVEKNAQNRIVVAALFLLLVIAIGTVGYHWIENMSFFDGLYMTFITLSTIGFNEIKSLSSEGRMFTMFLFISGFGVISYIITQTTQILFESELFLKRAMTKKLEAMKDHYIICGYGRIGQRIANMLKEAELPVVIIEQNAERIHEIEEEQHIYVEGDAQDENILCKAGVKQAKMLISTLSADQDNVFTTLLARELHPDIYILVRANQQSNKSRILRSGADKVISPYDVGADRMANVILKPHVERFIETINHDHQHDHTFEEVLINSDSELAGKTLSELHISNRFEVLIIAIIPIDGRIRFNPKSSDLIHAGDSLVILGEKQKINHFRSVICMDERSLADRAKTVQSTHKRS